MDTKQIDALIRQVSDQKERWARLALRKKITMLEHLHEAAIATSEAQVNAALRAKRISSDDPRAGEDYLGGPFVFLRNTRLLLKSLRDIETGGTPQLIPHAVKTRRDGQVVVDVFPQDTLERALFNGFRAQVWMEKTVTPAMVREQMASFYRRDAAERKGKVSLVLGAGNVASIGPQDVLYKLFVEGHVCVLKLNPVNDYLGIYVEQIFDALIQEGFVRLAYGGADVGAYLCQHALIDEIHITGSAATHDAIVFGPGEEGRARKENRTPLNTKQITSELGNVSPVIVVPGRWTDKELRFHAENVATQMTNNAGFNCNAAKVIVTHAKWEQRTRFLDELRAVLRELPLRYAYYPHAEERYERFTSTHPQTEQFGARRAGVLPWALIPDVDATNGQEICFREESFCGVTAETMLPGNDVGEFLVNAVRFCNETLWGTLNACVIVDPLTEKQLGAQFDQAIAKLHYGSIVTNHWPAISYGFGSTTWGAYPGHTIYDIQSGIGIVHNTFLFDKPEKSVIYGPFHMPVKPPWFVTHRRMHKVARHLVEIEYKHRWSKVLPIAIQSLLG